MKFLFLMSIPLLLMHLESRRCLASLSHPFQGYFYGLWKASIISTVNTIVIKTGSDYIIFITKWTNLQNHRTIRTKL